MHGGTIRQSQALPIVYTEPDRAAIGVADLRDVFGDPDSNGYFSETAPNAQKITASSSPVILSNIDLATGFGISRAIYFTATLAASEGIRLLPGSSIDLSGSASATRALAASPEPARKRPAGDWSRAAA